jgi:hypothetical protein
MPSALYRVEEFWFIFQSRPGKLTIALPGSVIETGGCVGLCCVLSPSDRARRGELNLLHVAELAVYRSPRVCPSG